MLFTSCTVALSIESPPRQSPIVAYLESVLFAAGVVGAVRGVPVALVVALVCPVGVAPGPAASVLDFFAKRRYPPTPTTARTSRTAMTMAATLPPLLLAGGVPYGLGAPYGLGEPYWPYWSSWVGG